VHGVDGGGVDGVSPPAIGVAATNANKATINLNIF
jgi:hypothetical protein